MKCNDPEEPFSNPVVKKVEIVKKENKIKREITKGPLFESEFGQYSQAVKEAIAYFLTVFVRYGLDKTKFCGRFKPSWKPKPGGTIPSKNRAFAQQHNLWHVHIGPKFEGDQYGDMTSDLIIHFQWHESRPEKIRLLSIAKHYTDTEPRRFTLPTLAHI